MDTKEASSEAEATTAGDSQPPTVRFVRSNVMIPWDAVHSNLLDFSEAHGIWPPFSCRAGVCGTCSTRMLCGRVATIGEPIAEPADGEILLCSSCPVTDIELDL